MKIIGVGKPALLDGIDIGPCVDSWMPEYLKATVGADRQIVVHVARSPAMSFQHKNFKYETMAFGEFIDAAFSQKSRLYFRSLSSAKPTALPANIREDFPKLAEDFILPSCLAHVTENLHSSPLRISSADVGMWLHYDGTANILCQISGRKLFRLYPPRDVTKLSFPAGATTSTLVDIFLQPPIPGTTPYELEMKAGDILFIPPLWLHAAKPLTPCVAVNVFFKSIESNKYPHGRDIYASRDLAAYEKGRNKLQGIVREFSGLPVDARRFYLSRLAEELKQFVDE
jgi:tRNA wybutosine-synthesizing protein 4